MRRVKHFGAFIFLLLAISFCQAIRAAQPSPIHAFDWLVGHTWSATSGLPPSVAHIDVHYEWAATSNFVQFSTQFVGADGSIKRRYAGNFYYDPTSRSIMMWYMNDNDEIIEGPVSLVGTTLRMSFQAADDSGKIENYRVDVTPTGLKSYRWTLFDQQSDTWRPELTLDYHQIN